MSLQGQLQTALEQLAQAAQRLDAAGALAAERRRELDELQLKCAGLQASFDEAEAKRRAAEQAESDFEQLKAEKEELVSVRNRLIAEKNQLLGEREQFKKFREGWGRERPALIKAKEDAEHEIRRLKEGGASASHEAEAGRIEALSAEIARLRSDKAVLEKEKEELAAEKESLSIEFDGIRQAYEELKQITAEASGRLDSTLEELKILRG